MCVSVSVCLSVCVCVLWCLGGGGVDRDARRSPFGVARFRDDTRARRSLARAAVGVRRHVAWSRAWCAFGRRKRRFDRAAGDDGRGVAVLSRLPLVSSSSACRRTASFARAHERRGVKPYVSPRTCCCFVRRRRGARWCVCHRRRGARVARPRTAHARDARGVLVVVLRTLLVRRSRGCSGRAACG